MQSHGWWHGSIGCGSALWAFRDGGDGGNVVAAVWAEADASAALGEDVESPSGCGNKHDRQDEYPDRDGELEQLGLASVTWQPLQMPRVPFEQPAA